MEPHTYLHGVLLSNFRGIADGNSYIGPFQRFNFFIGANNSGKSTVLHYIANYLHPLVSNYSRFQSQREKIKGLSDLDVRLGKNLNDIKLGMGISRQKITEQLKDPNNNPQKIRQWSPFVEKLLDHLSIDGIVYIQRPLNQDFVKIADDAISHGEFKKLLTDDEWFKVWNSLTRRSGGMKEQWITESVTAILTAIDIQLPNIRFIPAIRQISKKGNDFDDLSGKGLIEELARLQNPGPLEREKHDLFQSINKFLKSVTNNETATIEITHDREHVLVNIDDRRLPIENLGTGIHEVVMIAAFCTLYSNNIICIEEPEIHLHPILQKRLMLHLLEYTNNQYFIATHSASLIDSIEAAVFNVQNINANTIITHVTTESSRFNLIRDLGYRASDILQANYIIWVEGPSDRVYISHWISSAFKQYREGIEYSIMFYGGKLLSHLTAEVLDSEVNAFIELCRINRNFAIVMDSDRKTSADTLNATKDRLINELENSGIAWVTSGREIENYIPTKLMSDALSNTQPSYSKRFKTGQYDHVLPYKDIDGKINKVVDKVAIARHIAAQPADLSILDLDAQISRIGEAIRLANSN